MQPLLRHALVIAIAAGFGLAAYGLMLALVRASRALGWLDGSGH